MTGSRRPRPSEVAGFLEGVEHRLRAHRADGHADPVAEALVADARRLIDGRDWVTAADRLEDAARRLDAARPEPPLTEWPRGLVGYVPLGPEGGPPDREEEPIANRLLLIHRLLEVRRRSGWDVTSLYPLLAEAEAAYRSHDLQRARALGDEVHRRLEGSAGDG